MGRARKNQEARQPYSIRLSLYEHALILSILVDTFFTRISMPKLQLPESRNISAA